MAVTMLLSALLLSCATSKTSEVVAVPAPSPIVYPDSPRGGVVDDYHGVSVADPYRWLEDSDAPETRAWIEAQNALTESILSTVPERAAIRARLEDSWDYERLSPPSERGGRYFWSRQAGLQDQPVLMVGDAPYAADARPLIDPNALSDDGTVALSGSWVSPDGGLIVYALSEAGTDWKLLRVRDVATGEDLPDRLEHIKFSDASWDPAGEGFYYGAYDPPTEPAELETANYYQKLRYHRLGTPQADDPVVYERPDEKEWGFGGDVSDDGAWLIIHNWVGTEQRNRVFLKDLREPDAEVVELIGEFDASYSFIGDHEGRLFFLTDLDAPNSRVISIDPANPARAQWRELIPESSSPLRGVKRVGEQLIVSRLVHAHTEIERYDLDGASLGALKLPGLGTAGGLSGHPGSTETFLRFTSYLDPGGVYRLDLETGALSLVAEPEVDFDASLYTTRQVFYSSADGVHVPMTLVHRKDMVADGQNPTYLYGYGGFNIPILPAFSPVYKVWLEMGGVLAVANLRGGGEYGRDWHDAGRLGNKQSVFDDLHAGAEWLIAEGVTTSPKLAIGGRSNGGLLVGAAITQRPELYGAALPGVGVMDMLRFHRFTIGWAWVSDYGSSDDPEQFEWLYAYSPLHNLTPGVAYPATLITTGDHDDRVVPGHSFKFAAALQAAQGGPEPALIRVDVDAGHGAGKPTSKVIGEWTDNLSFLVRELEMTLPESFAGPKD